MQTQDNTLIIIQTSVANLEDADKLTAALLEHKLAACVSIGQAMLSHYYWQRTLQKETEYPLIIKTSKAKMLETCQFIRKNHPYQVPEIIAIRCEYSDPDYQKWLEDYVSESK